MFELIRCHFCSYYNKITSLRHFSLQITYALAFVWTALFVLQRRILSNIVCHYFCGILSPKWYAKPSQGGGVYVSLFFWNKLAYSCVPSIFVFLYSPFPSIVSVPLKIWPFFLCSPEINSIFPFSPKPLRMPHMLQSDRPGQWAQQSIIHIVWLQSNQIGQILNL